jgi:hypothetical protein
MEILIILAVFAVAAWFLFFREGSSVSVAAPYKIETPPTPVPAQDVAPQPDLVIVAEGAGVVTSPTLTSDTVVLAEPAVVPPAVVEAPVKKPRKPRAPKAVAEPVKVAAKKAAPVKKAAAIKAAPKKPTTPRSKKA